MDFKEINKILGQPHWLYCILATLFGVLFVFLTPPLWGLDETSHFARTYQLSRGEIIPDKRSIASYGGYVPANYNSLVYHAISDIGEAKNPDILKRKDVNDLQGYATFTNQHFSTDKKQSTGTATYSPIAYAAPALGVVISNILNLSIGGAIHAARIASVIFSAAVIGLGLWIVRGRKVAWLIFSVAALPVTIFQSAVVTADSATNALALLLVALLFRAYTAKEEVLSKNILYSLVVTAILLPLVKVNYIFLSFGLLLLPGIHFGGIKKARLVKVLATLAVIIPALLWSIITKVTSDAPKTQRPDGLAVNAAQQIAFMSHHPLAFLAACVRSTIISGDAYLQQLVTLIGWNYVVMPLAITLFSLGIVILAGIYAKDEASFFSRKLLGLNLLSIIGIVSIFASLYVAFTPPAYPTVDGIQGRYFIPFLVPAMLLIASLVPVKLTIPRRHVAPIFSGVAVLSLVVCSIYYGLATY